jgi:hypothetical protein
MNFSMSDSACCHQFDGDKADVRPAGLAGGFARPVLRVPGSAKLRSMGSISTTENEIAYFTSSMSGKGQLLSK